MARSPRLGHLSQVTSEIEQTWTNLHELEPDGSPRLVLRERFHIESWMTSDMVWAVVYVRHDDGIDRSRTHYEQLWKKDEGFVRVRAWQPESDEYDVRRFECTTDFGPEDGFMASQGCIYFTTMASWLAGAENLEDRVSARSVALTRTPNLAIVPPDTSQNGIWLDVFEESLERDKMADPDSLYRRHDFMLLARNERQEPELREWRTIVLTDPTNGGRTPQEIVGRERLQYEFHDALPSEVRSAMDSFSRDVDQSLAGKAAP